MLPYVHEDHETGEDVEPCSLAAIRGQWFFGLGLTSDVVSALCIMGGR